MLFLRHKKSTQRLGYFIEKVRKELAGRKTAPFSRKSRVVIPKLVSVGRYPIELEAWERCI